MKAAGAIPSRVLGRPLSRREALTITEARAQAQAHRCPTYPPLPHCPPGATHGRASAALAAE